MNKVFVGFLLLVFISLIPSVANAKTIWASWYQHGKVTANGERYYPDGMTVAHRSLPFGTKLRLTYRGKSVIVRVNDRGPFIGGRQLDLSRGAARELGCIDAGVCKIDMEILD
jgi:rare lipoprotein A